MNSFSALDSNYRRGRCLSHIDTEGLKGLKLIESPSHENRVQDENSAANLTKLRSICAQGGQVLDIKRHRSARLSSLAQHERYRTC
jgi:hypothetical protein